MIKFEIIGLTDHLDGVHSYNLNKVRIGKDRGHLFIPSLQRNNIISFEIDSKGSLVVQSTQNFWINDNKLKDRANLVNNDLLTVQEGMIKIKVLDFSYTKTMKLKDYVNKQLDLLILNDKDLVKTLSSIKK